MESSRLNLDQMGLWGQAGQSEVKWSQVVGGWLMLGERIVIGWVIGLVTRWISGWLMGWVRGWIRGLTCGLVRVWVKG